jgi:hypothetical protein
MNGSLIRTNTFKTTKVYAALAAFLIAISSTVLVSAEAVVTVTVTPYDNLSKTSPTTVTVTGSGLEPNSEVALTQHSVAPYSTAEGDPHNDGVKVERVHRGVVTTSPSGTISTTAVVGYDIVPGGTINYCDFNRANDVRRLCFLELRYMDGPLAGEVIVQHPLYFGMSDPNGGGGTDPEDPAGPMTKDDCKDDKWMGYTTLGFKNQGECVASVAKLQR